MSVWRSGPLPVIQTSVMKSVHDTELISLHREITATNTRSATDLLDHGSLEDTSPNMWVVEYEYWRAAAGGSVSRL